MAGICTKLIWQPYPQHIIFPGGSVALGSHWPNVWSVDSECKTKVYFKQPKNSTFLNRISLL